MLHLKTMEKQISGRIKSVKVFWHTSNLSSLDAWLIGSVRNSSVKRKHSPTFSGETKSNATLIHDCKRKTFIMDFHEKYFKFTLNKINQATKSKLAVRE